MSDSPLTLTSEGAVRLLTIDRQARMNALDREALSLLASMLAGIARDQSARVLVITGAGDRAFIAGADISEFSAFTPADARAYALAGQRVFRQIETLDIPTIAAINGYALGGGCELALACTFRLMADGASIGLPEITLGLIPGFGGTQRLSRLVGRQRALEMVLTGRRVPAAEALAMGLVLRAVPAAELMTTAMAFAEDLASRAPLAVRYALDAVDAGLDMPLQQACDTEAALFALAAATDDMREGVTAFLEKRAPSFTGR
jgi:enoyl-CoA hydratase